ncbi:hypothetical protein niasHT_008020 [Heterodera trifolii]|uniref:Uncharacterized protein n=1 Tax=Heterodera trifolii TaxID=157864 RepID=A0ABD2LZQ2_9BILA
MFVIGQINGVNDVFAFVTDVNGKEFRVPREWIREPMLGNYYQFDGTFLESDVLEPTSVTALADANGNVKLHVELKRSGRKSKNGAEIYCADNFPLVIDSSGLLNRFLEEEPIIRHAPDRKFGVWCAPRKYSIDGINWKIVQIDPESKPKKSVPNGVSKLNGRSKECVSNGGQTDECNSNSPSTVPLSSETKNCEEARNRRLKASATVYNDIGCKMCHENHLVSKCPLELFNKRCVACRVRGHTPSGCEALHAWRREGLLTYAAASAYGGLPPQGSRHCFACLSLYHILNDCPNELLRDQYIRFVEERGPDQRIRTGSRLEMSTVEGQLICQQFPYSGRKFTQKPLAFGSTKKVNENELFEGLICSQNETHFLVFSPGRRWLGRLDKAKCGKDSASILGMWIQFKIKNKAGMKFVDTRFNFTRQKIIATPTGDYVLIRCRLSVPPFLEVSETPWCEELRTNVIDKAEILKQEHHGKTIRAVIGCPSQVVNEDSDILKWQLLEVLY